MTFSADAISSQLLQASSLSGTCFVAFSGGLDSSALLHALVEFRQQRNFNLVALHGDHGLQPASVAWAQQCAKVCAAYDVEFRTTRLKLADASELAARNARYEWFRKQVRYGDVLLTAHHQQDRAETVLFNLLRGAGSAGLSSMRAARPFYGAQLLRPMLGFSQAEVLEYAQQNQLQWIEDPSNQLDDYARNRIRHHVLPALQGFRGDAVCNIARAASNLEQENQLLREIAIADLADVREHSRHALDNSRALCFDDMQMLSPARQTNVLRFWLNSHQLHLPSKRLMQQLVDCISSPPSSTAVLQEEGCQYRFYRGYLYVMPASPEPPAFEVMEWPNLEQPLTVFGQQLRIDATSKLRQFYQGADAGQLKLLPRAGISNPKAPQGHSLNLKKWLQDIGVPPWRRHGLPLLTLRQGNQDLVLAPVDQHLANDWIMLQQDVA